MFIFGGFKVCVGGRDILSVDYLIKFSVIFKREGVVMVYWFLCFGFFVVWVGIVRGSIF